MGVIVLDRVIQCVTLRLIYHMFDLYYLFFQAEDGIRDLVRSRGLGDVYKRQLLNSVFRNWKMKEQS